VAEVAEQHSSKINIDIQSKKLVMRLPFSKTILSLVALSCIETAFCQYGGGAGKGESSIGLNAVSLAGDKFQILYAGGNGQGSTVGNIFSITVDGNALASIYGGSAGKGDVQANLFAQSLAGENLNVLFVGSAGRGDRVGIRNSFALGGEAGDIVYYGGVGRGDTAITSLNNALFDCTLQNMWSGKISTAWEDMANWTCNELPGVNSLVLITSGVARYPVVNASTEIRRIQIDPGASVTVKAGFQLKLNGQ
jgi:hypothetical protein